MPARIAASVCVFASLIHHGASALFAATTEMEVFHRAGNGETVPNDLQMLDRHLEAAASGEWYSFETRRNGRDDGPSVSAGAAVTLMAISSMAGSAQPAPVAQPVPDGTQASVHRGEELFTG